MIKSKRIGIVRVTVQLINDAPDIAHLLFTKFIPLRAEIMPQGWIEYIGVSELFDEREEGVNTPQYDFIIVRGEDGLCRIEKVEKV